MTPMNLLSACYSCRLAACIASMPFVFAFIAFNLLDLDGSNLVSLSRCVDRWVIYADLSASLRVDPLPQRLDSFKGHSERIQKDASDQARWRIADLRTPSRLEKARTHLYQISLHRDSVTGLFIAISLNTLQSATNLHQNTSKESNMKIARNLCIKYSVFILLALLTSGAAIAPWLLPSTATAQPLESEAKDEVFGVTHVINLPVTPVVQKLTSFDMRFVDPAHGSYLLADRPNKSIDVVNTSNNQLIHQFQPGFVGSVAAANCSTGGANDCSGPDGVLVANGNQVWVGDGNSRVWVLDVTTGAVIKGPISTALPTTTDQTRADELCHDDDNHIILVANDASEPH